VRTAEAKRVKYDAIDKRDSHSVFTRRRFQLAGAILFAALLPYALRYLLKADLHGFVLFGSNALVGNLAAVLIAFWMRLSIETYPGIQRSYVLLPTALVAHALVLTFFVVTLVPYDRVSLGLGFVFHVLWNYAAYFIGQRRYRPRIGVVPFGQAPALANIEGVDWVFLKQPKVNPNTRFTALVADFSTDLPDEWEAYLADAALAGRIVYQVKQLAESLTGRVELTQLSDNSFGMLVPARGYFYVKTAADFVVAMVALPVLLPVMLGAAIAIALQHDGPILFRQRRLGHAGRTFVAYKFRTMKVTQAPEDSAQARDALATDENDPRITKVGRVLRHFRIDELPQVFNILKGEMSWIGPRPEPEQLSRFFATEIPFYRYRHVVKPGISGWAQVNQGYASGVDGINTKLKYDFYYIKYFSPWLDILILMRTIKTMLTGFGSR
jgi:lipopolysaccharide/colanic/teichoic acid biosynthesis glycosyltransferase